ncbi:hypothetical protein ACLOJK_029744 [Asimina triloba]
MVGNEETVDSDNQFVDEIGPISAFCQENAVSRDKAAGTIPLEFLWVVYMKSIFSLDYNSQRDGYVHSRSPVGDSLQVFPVEIQLGASGNV